MLTIPQIIEIAKISQYLSENDIAKKGLYGGGMDLLLPRKIYCVRKNVEWQQDVNPSVAEVNAVGYITIDDIGEEGNTIEVFVNDPVLGVISLGIYTRSASDTDTTILATNIASAIASNAYGYTVTSALNVIEVTARPGIGAQINGGNNLYVVVTVPSLLITEANAIITTEDSLNLIIE